LIIYILLHNIHKDFSFVGTGIKEEKISIYNMHCEATIRNVATTVLCKASQLKVHRQSAQLRELRKSLRTLDVRGSGSSALNYCLLVFSLSSFKTLKPLVICI